MLTDERKQIIVNKVFEILHDNGLSREEIQRIFIMVGPEDEGTEIPEAADRFIKLFIEEKLSIEEGVTVFREIKSRLGHCMNDGFSV